MSSLLAGASDAKKSGMVKAVRRGRDKKSTGHSVRRSSVVLKLEQAMTQEAVERFAVGAGHGVLIEIS